MYQMENFFLTEWGKGENASSRERRSSLPRDD